MSSAIVAFSRRLSPLARIVRQQSLAFALLAAAHLAALTILIWTEARLVPQLVFILGWIFFNCGWLILLRRPVFAGAITLSFLVLLLALSRFKHEILLMTVNFLDLLLIDPETVAFLIQIFPNFDAKALAGFALLFLGLVTAWRCDPFRIARSKALKGAAASLATLVGLALAVPGDPWEEFYAENYFSKYLRSGVTVLSDLATRGILDSDKTTAERLAAPAAGPCSVAKPPHIIMIHDESSFDARAIPGIKVPDGYGRHFLSDDGRQRTLLVEGAGGPSWFTEYNILTGLSVRSYGRFADFVTRIAAGRVERGLPQNLRSCGYRTFTLYPMYGSFMSARAFQGSAGIDHFLDSRALGARFQDTDAFYFNAAADRLAQERVKGPTFQLVYTAQNHFPWNFRFRPDLAPQWRDPGNRADVDEYLRRQHLTAVDYQAFKARLLREFPDEPILLVRFGDHQPYFARSMIDPSQNDGMVARRIAAADPRFLATYYSIEAINYTPRDTSLAHDALDAPYLPLVVLEAAGVPLDPSFAEQKRILQRCQGLFYRCNGGAEARRFNRLLIDAGKIKGL